MPVTEEPETDVTDEPEMGDAEGGSRRRRQAATPEPDEGDMNEATDSPAGAPEATDPPAGPPEADEGDLNEATDAPAAAARRRRQAATPEPDEGDMDEATDPPPGPPEADEDHPPNHNHPSAH